MTQPTTWEEATCDVAVALPSWREGAELTLDEVLVDIEETLDDLRGGDHEKNEYATFRYLAWLGAVGYVLERRAAQYEMGFVDRCEEAMRGVLSLLPLKQHDYGPDNILWGGVQGVVVRAHDKLARIKNLRERAAKRQTLNGGASFTPDAREVMNEPLTDSYFDMIGYGIVGAMLVKGTFQLPLEADLVEREKPKPDPHLQNGFFNIGQQKEIEQRIADAIEDVRAIVRDELAKREHSKVAKHRTIGTGKTYG